jgi:transcriptional regulator with XRE-family HTH domain
MDAQTRVARNIRHFRKEKGFSQEALTFECGLHRTYISGVERGVRNPTVKILGRIATALKVDVELLLTVPLSSSSAKSGNIKKRR